MRQVFQLLAVLAFAVWSGFSHAGHIRYDVTVESSSLFTGYLGYMVFSDPGPGDIMPSIVDWRFEFAGQVLGATSPGADVGGYFEVDANGEVDSDARFVCVIACFVIFPSFVSDEYGLFFSRDLGVLETGGELYDATISYSGPIEVSGQAPVPATLALVGLGLVGLGWSRRKKA